MDSPKYLIIITLIDGQNFTVPDGSPDKIEATVFAEARFGNESKLTSDPIKLTNSNPEFVTELAWQVDKRSLHQLRVERKAIKLQIFMQTQERRRHNQLQSSQKIFSDSLDISDSDSTHKIELIGYTVIDIRTAQEREQPKFKWLPLLNPKFRKSSYNRPEVQLALTLSRIDENANNNDIKPLPSTSSLPTQVNRTQLESLELETCSNNSDSDSLVDSRLYKTCLDITSNSEQLEKEQIIENDIIIQSKGEFFYIYDTRDASKPNIDDCKEQYRIVITIPFNSELETLVTKPEDEYYFSVTLFGASLRSAPFGELTSVETKALTFNIYTTSSSVLARYFELNSSLEIKLTDKKETVLGSATIQIEQLCSLDSKCRSIEGIFAMQSALDNDIPASPHPTIGVSVVLEKVDNDEYSSQKLISDDHIKLAKEHFVEDIDEYLFKTLNDTHQLTFDVEKEQTFLNSINTDALDNNIVQDNQHFCFTIDLKNFSYTPDQRLIPTLRELVVRYAYPFFGYKDTITTDASIPISSSNSIIVSGFCEFNFATTTESLLTALREIPLNLEILACEQIKRIELNCSQTEHIVATSSLNLAQTMSLDETNIVKLKENQVNATVSTPIYSLDGEHVGELQVYLCLKNLGEPNYNLKASIEATQNTENGREITAQPSSLPLDTQRIDAFICEAKYNLEHWKNDYCYKLSEEVRKREVARFKRLYQRLEAREAKREFEFKNKMEELNKLEKQFKTSFIYIENLEQELSHNLKQLRAKDAMLESQLESLDSRLSKAVNNIKLDYERRLDSYSVRRSTEDNRIETKHQPTRISTKPIEVRRSSLRSSNTIPGIPIPIRSSSLVRGPSDGSTRLLKRPTTMITTVVNGTSCRSRSISTRLNLSKETQEKLISLRREKAELLKRGCRPNDELIQEINSLIEKLAC